MTRRAFPLVCIAALALASTNVAGQTPRTLEEALSQLESLQADQGRTLSEVEGLVEQRDVARRRLRQRVRVFYRMRRAGALPLSRGFDSLIRHQSRVDRLEHLVSRDARALRALSSRVSALGAESERLSVDVAAGEREVAARRSVENARVRELAMLSEMIEDPASWSGPSMDGFGLRVSGGGGSAYRLAQDRGNLPLPVGGSAQIADAEREGGQGLAITASAGVSVRAVGPGSVAYAAPHPAYGRLAIVDHGDGHYTVYGGLGRIGVRPGDEVQRDSPLGVVGASPIFFQVRRGTRPLPAREWLGI